MCNNNRCVCHIGGGVATTIANFATTVMQWGTVSAPEPGPEPDAQAHDVHHCPRMLLLAAAVIAQESTDHLFTQVVDTIANYLNQSPVHWRSLVGARLLDGAAHCSPNDGMAAILILLASQQNEVLTAVMTHGDESELRARWRLLAKLQCAVLWHYNTFVEAGVSRVYGFHDSKSPAFLQSVSDSLLDVLQKSSTGRYLGAMRAPCNVNGACSSPPAGRVSRCACSVPPVSPIGFADLPYCTYGSLQEPGSLHWLKCRTAMHEIGERIAESFTTDELVAALAAMMDELWDEKYPALRADLTVSISTRGSNTSGLWCADCGAVSVLMYTARDHEGAIAEAVLSARRGGCRKTYSRRRATVSILHANVVDIDRRFRADVAPLLLQSGLAPFVDALAHELELIRGAGQSSDEPR